MYLPTESSPFVPHPLQSIIVTVSLSKYDFLYVSVPFSCLPNIACSLAFSPPRAQAQSISVCLAFFLSLSLHLSHSPSLSVSFSFLVLLCGLRSTLCFPPTLSSSLALSSLVFTLPYLHSRVFSLSCFLTCYLHPFLFDDSNLVCIYNLSSSLYHYPHHAIPWNLSPFIPPYCVALSLRFFLPSSLSLHVFILRPNSFSISWIPSPLILIPSLSFFLPLSLPTSLLHFLKLLIPLTHRTSFPLCFSPWLALAASNPSYLTDSLRYLFPCFLTLWHIQTQQQTHTHDVSHENNYSHATRLWKRTKTQTQNLKGTQWPPMVLHTHRHTETPPQKLKYDLVHTLPGFVSFRLSDIQIHSIRMTIRKRKFTNMHAHIHTQPKKKKNPDIIMRPRSFLNKAKSNGITQSFEPLNS